MITLCMFNGCDKKPLSSGPFTEQELRESFDKPNDLTAERKSYLLNEINRYKDAAPIEKNYSQVWSTGDFRKNDEFYGILFEAIRSQDKEILNALETSKVSLNDKRARLVFYNILDYGDMDSANFLIKRGILEDKKTADIAIFNAACAYKNRTELINLVARTGNADVNVCDKEMGLLLNWVAFKGYADSVQTLITLGADVNKKDDYFEETPLHVAAKYGNWEVAQVLLSNGTDYTIKNKVGRTPLDIAMGSTDMDHESITGKWKVQNLIRQYMKKDD